MTKASHAPHIPVLFKEVLTHAAVREGALWVDCTLGRGGHSEGLLRAGARVIGIDKDPSALRYCEERLAPFEGSFELIRADFRSLSKELRSRGITEVDGILADLGVSSPQLDEGSRGFSFMSSGPVDMRMDPERGEPASAWIDRLSELELTDALRRYGEEPLARPLARAIKRWSAQGGGDTLSLARAIEEATPAKVRYRNPKKHPATRSFQALRIAVNDELGELDRALKASIKCLKPGGRLVVVSFHSLEDRRVKTFFREKSGDIPRGSRHMPMTMPENALYWFTCPERKPRTPSPGEMDTNPRARSAKLRYGIRTEHEV